MVSPVVLTTGTDRQLIPFNRPTASGREADYIAQALSAGHLSGDGAFTRHCSKLLEQETGAAKALLTTSCTHALEMAALLLDLRPGDEVIVPSFTFVSTLNAFVLRGARPRCVDIRADTLNIDETLIEREINERTRAIFLVQWNRCNATSRIHALSASSFTVPLAAIWQPCACRRCSMR